jgi:serine/threonine-protein kinase
MFSVANDPPTPLRHLLPQAPAGLEAVILRCLEKDRTRRYANVADLALALCPFAPRRARESAERISRTLKQAGLPVVHPEPVPGSGVGSQALSAPRSRVGKKAAKAAAAALFAVGLVSVVAWVALHGTPSHAPASDHDVVAAALPASAASSAVTALGEAAHPPVLPPPEPAPAAADAGTSAPAALSAPAVSVRPAERRPSPSGAPATPRSRPSAQPAPAPTYDPLNHL